ncbi:MAG: YkgJ family cysteine cluster protein [Candidatus Bathyarchaeia archaeon]
MDFTYPVNVRFECNRCGLCCGDTKQKSRHILLLDSEAKLIASQTSKLLTDFSTEIIGRFPYCYEMKKTNEGKCFFLRENQCAIYPLRPLICMFYPFELKFDNGKVLHAFSFTTECPAIGIGKNFDEIDFERLFELAQKKLLRVAGGYQAVPK